MAIYNYLTKDSEGKRKEGEVRADSLDTAIQKLSANGQLVITLKEVDDTFDFLLRSFSRPKRSFGSIIQFWWIDC